MIPGAESRLAIVVVLLALQIIIFVLELLVFSSTIKKLKWYTALRQWIGPIGIGCLGVILISIIFANTKAEIKTTGKQCSTSVDADIAGIGVRVAAFVQVCALILVLLLGSFHPKATGAKEVGAGLVLTSVSLAIALIVRSSQGSLTLVDAAIGAMILDGQSVALSIQLAAKETLTSRWQTVVVVSAQFISLGTIPAIVNRFNHRAFASKECSCLTIFWWGWLDKCQPSTSSLEHAIFWTYLACRFVGALQVTFHSLWNMKSFDRAEKDTRDTGDELMKLGGTLIKITYPHYSVRGSARYGEYPATVTFMFVLYGLFALTSLVTAETSIRALDISASSGVDSVGQIIALVIAGSTVLRSIWLFGFLFWHQDSGTFGLTWPFNLKRSMLFSSPTYIIAPGSLSPDDLPLGAILREPFRLDNKYDSHVPVPLDQVKDITMGNWNHSRHRALSLTHWGTLFSTVTTETDSMKTRWFIPNEDYLSACVAQPEITGNIGPGTGTVTVLLVVGVRIATGLVVTEKKGRTVEAELSTAEMFAASQVIWQQQNQTSHLPKQEVLYSYRLEEYTVTRDGRVISGPTNASFV